MSTRQNKWSKRWLWQRWPNVHTTHLALPDSFHIPHENIVIHFKMKNGAHPIVEHNFHGHFIRKYVRLLVLLYRPSSNRARDGYGKIWAMIRYVLRTPQCYTCNFIITTSFAIFLLSFVCMNRGFFFCTEFSVGSCRNCIFFQCAMCIAHITS